MADEDTKSYGSPMGTEKPGETTRERPQAAPGPSSDLRAALANRYSGEAKRETDAPPGGRRLLGTRIDPDAPTKDLSASKAARNIKDRQYADRKTIDEAG